MSRRLPFLSRSIASFAVFFVALLATGPVIGQRDEGEVALGKRAKETRDLRSALLKGEKPASSADKEHKEAIEVAVRLVLEPFTWPHMQRERGKIERNFSILENNLDVLAKNKPASDNAAQMYARQVIEQANKMIAIDKEKPKEKPIVAVNAARALAALVERSGKLSEAAWVANVLPRLAGGNAELLATTLTEYISKLRKDKPSAGVEPYLYNPAVRYYALRGLRELLAIPPAKNPLKGKAAQEKAVAQIIRFAERSRKFPRSARRSEIEGYKVLRREAVRALARYRSPRAGEKDLPALTLARFAGNDARITPEPRLDERLEAAIGLARMLPTPRHKDYRPDQASYQVARLVTDFANAANREKDRKPGSRTRPWKVDAARLAEALQVLKGFKDAYAAKVLERAAPILANVEKGNDARVADLGNWLADNAPPSSELFKGIADSTVKVRAAAEE
jgi:hypothetical protein